MHLFEGLFSRSLSDDYISASLKEKVKKRTWGKRAFGKVGLLTEELGAPLTRLGMALLLIELAEAAADAGFFASTGFG